MARLELRDVFQNVTSVEGGLGITISGSDSIDDAGVKYYGDITIVATAQTSGLYAELTNRGDTSLTDGQLLQVDTDTSTIIGATPGDLSVSHASTAGAITNQGALATLDAIDLAGDLVTGIIGSDHLPDISYGDIHTYMAADATLATFITAWNAGTDTGITTSNNPDLHANDIVTVIDTTPEPDTVVTYLYTGDDSTFPDGNAPSVTISDSDFTQISTIDTSNFATKSQIPSTGTVPENWDNIGTTNNTNPTRIPKWDGDSFENSNIYEGYLDSLSSTVTQLTFDSSTAATTVTITLSEPAGENLATGDLVNFSLFSSSIPGFAGTSNSTLVGRFGAITTINSQTSFVVTFDGDPINVGVTTVPSGIQELSVDQFILTRPTNSSPLFYSGNLIVSESLTVDGTINGNLNGGIDVDESGTGSAGGTYNFRIADSGDTGAAGFITFVRES